MTPGVDDHEDSRDVLPLVLVVWPACVLTNQRSIATCARKPSRCWRGIAGTAI